MADREKECNFKKVKSFKMKFSLRAIIWWKIRKTADTSFKARAVRYEIILSKMATITIDDSL